MKDFLKMKWKELEEYYEKNKLKNNNYHNIITK